MGSPYDSRRSYLTATDRWLFALAVAIVIPAFLFGFPYFVLALFAVIVGGVVVALVRSFRGRRARPLPGIAVRRRVRRPHAFRNDRSINPGD